MTSAKLLVAAAAMLVTTGAAAAAHADDFKPNAAGAWIVDARISDVSPDTSAAIKTGSGGATGLHVHVSDDVMPTLGFTYFFTDKIAVEAILGTTEHNIDAVGAGGSTKVHSTWVLPPVVSIQYHPLPAARFSPYVGAGVNAMIYYGGKNYNGYTVDVKDSLGVALQAGVDIALKGPYIANVDIKKVWVTSDASVDGGAFKSNVDLNPWVFSVGIGRKF